MEITEHLPIATDSESDYLHLGDYHETGISIGIIRGFKSPTLAKVLSGLPLVSTHCAASPPNWPRQLAGTGIATKKVAKMARAKTPSPISIRKTKFSNQFCITHQAKGAAIAKASISRRVNSFPNSHRMLLKLAPKTLSIHHQHAE